MNGFSLTSLYNRYINHRTLWVYVVCIVLLVVLPINGAKKLNDIMVIRIRGDYLMHMLLFLPWAGFWKVYRPAPGVWVLAGLLFGTGMEGLQYLLPYRAFNINDMVANGMGVLTGSFICLIFAKFNQTRVP